MKISPARVAAFDILTKIEKEKAFSSILLPVYEQNLTPKDRGLCHELTLGTLRRQLYLDRLIETATAGKKLETPVKIALRLGLYQLLFLDKIPAYSAINESVNLVQRAKKMSAKGLVNAVLRRATREKIELRFKNPLDKLSVETSHPKWILEKWSSQFGAEEAEKIARANNEIARIAFRATAKTSPEAFEILKNYSRSQFVENGFVAEKFDADLLELAERGEVYVQDEASQMVAQTIDLQSGQSFLDVCAAPGSKATFAAGAFGQSLIVAGDLYAPRVKILKENCEKQGFGDIRIVHYDAEKELPFADESFDAVLLDAPCTGTGTIRHNPEIRYFLKKGDFAELSGKQLELLKNASKLVKQGGKLIYSTCSLEREENEAVIERFLAQSVKFRKSEPPVAEVFKTEETFARTFPHRDRMDGFFIAALERRRIFRGRN